MSPTPPSDYGELVELLRSGVTSYPASVFPDSSDSRDAISGSALRNVAVPKFQAAADCIEDLIEQLEAKDREIERLVGFEKAGHLIGLQLQQAEQRLQEQAAEIERLNGCAERDLDHLGRTYRDLKAITEEVEQSHHEIKRLKHANAELYATSSDFAQKAEQAEQRAAEARRLLRSLLGFAGLHKQIVMGKDWTPEIQAAKNFLESKP